MDARTRRIAGAPDIRRPTLEDAEAAVRTLLAWAGDDPGRAALIDTPGRVARAYREYFRGYDEDPCETLSKTFAAAEGYDDIVMVRDIDFYSHCEHHIVPFIGRAHVAYLPSGVVIGISKLARVVEVFARRLQTQEALTAQIANAIDHRLKPRGVAVMLEAVHQCMSLRGVNKRNATTVTTQFTGEFRTNPVMQGRFTDLVRSPGASTPL